MKNMDAESIIQLIKNSKKITPVKVYLKGDLKNIDFGHDCKTFIEASSGVVFGDWTAVEKILTEYKELISDYVVENDRRNSSLPLLETKHLNARIEPGAIIRDQVHLGDNSIVMMGAVINIGSSIGNGTMIDMNVVIGGRGTIGSNCHIGAGAVIAGVIEPPSALPVVIEDNVVVGANAVILEGVRVKKGSVVAAGAVVTEDVPEGVVVAGTPAKVIKKIDEKTKSKTQIREELRNLK